MTTTITILIAVFSFLITTMVGLITYIFHQSQASNKEATAELRAAVLTNGKHLDSIIHTVWLITWRINGVEDYLGDTTDFRPPRIIGESEVFKNGDQT